MGVRNEMCQASSNLQDLLKAISQGDPWSYAQCEVPTFAELKQALDDAKSASPFWSSWALSADFKR